ncbi:hypothetical protein FI667_g8479, partial [Globisporangium splendens]
MRARVRTSLRIKTAPTSAKRSAVKAGNRSHRYKVLLATSRKRNVVNAMLWRQKNSSVGPKNASAMRFCSTHAATRSGSPSTMRSAAEARDVVPEHRAAVEDGVQRGRDHLTRIRVKRRDFGFQLDLVARHDTVFVDGSVHRVRVDTQCRWLLEHGAELCRSVHASAQSTHDHPVAVRLVVQGAG